MARLRSFAHLGTTRSGQRCMARWAVLRHQTPQGREVDDHAVVEIGLPQRCHALDLIEEGAQLGREGFLTVQLLALAGGGAVAVLAAQAVQFLLLVA